MKCHFRKHGRVKHLREFTVELGCLVCGILEKPTKLGRQSSDERRVRAIKAGSLILLRSQKYVVRNNKRTPF
jgi:hypothetical protein